MNWHKSSYSSTEGNCVEVAELPGACAVRDSKHPSAPVLTVTSRQWAAFTARVRNGEFD